MIYKLNVKSNNLHEDKIENEDRHENQKKYQFQVHDDLSFTMINYNQIHSKSSL